MRQSFSKFMDTLAMSLDIAALYEALSQATAAIGFQRFAYLSVHGSGRTKPMLISNYPIAWTERYFELHYDRFDPVLLQARTSNEPFLWGPAFHPSKEHASHGDFFEEASAFGIRAGFTVPLGATDRRFTLASFASDERAASVCHLVDAHASALLKECSRAICTLQACGSRNESTNVSPGLLRENPRGTSGGSSVDPNAP
jgi:hypothetical protein